MLFERNIYSVSTFLPENPRKNPETGALEGTIGSVMRGSSAFGIGVHMTGSYQSLVDYAALLHMYDVRLCAVKPR